MNASRDLTAAASPLPTASGRHRSVPPRTIVFVVVVVVLIAAFAKDLISLFGGALHSDLNSYIVLIPLVAMYFLYIERGLLSSERNTSLLWALAPLITGSAAIFLAASFAGSLSQNDRLSAVTFAFV